VSSLAAIGPLTNGTPRGVLVIGSGTGGTPYAAGLNPATEKVKVIEIVAPVIETLKSYTAAGGKSAHPVSARNTPTPSAPPSV